MTIYEDEQLDDLQINELKIIQKKKGFKFGTDAVLLSDFASEIHSESILDLCTGTGIVALLLSAKTNAERICAIEIQEDIAGMAQRSVEMNGLDKRIFIKCGDLKTCVSDYGKRSFGLVTCNPPYMRAGAGVPNESDSKLVSRHEVMCTLEDVIRTASGLVSVSGHFAMVHRPSRLCDAMYLMRKYEIEPKRLRFVHKNAKEAPILFLIDGLYKGKSDVKILPPLILYNENGEETEELKIIYGRENGEIKV